MPAAPTEFDLEGFLRTLTTRPGVYRMFDADGKVLYVGKARNLKRRVTSYFRPGAAHDAKTRRLTPAMFDDVFARVGALLG